MRLTFDDAKWTMDMSGAWLMLKVPDIKQANQFISEMKEGKTYIAELKQFRQKRSLDANAMAWKLIGDLSAVLRIPPNVLYREYIKDVGGNYEIIPVREDKIDAWNYIWCSGHIGRHTEDIGECRTIPGYHYIKSYIGSSDYDTAQMSRLLDLITADCRENGIDVISNSEKALLMDGWEKKRGMRDTNPGTACDTDGGIQ